MRVLVILICFSLVVVPCLSAKADVIGFDDVTANTAYVPNGYHGLHWSNTPAVNTLFYPGLDWGIQAGLISPTSDVTNGNGDPAIISSASPFIVNSAYLTGLWNDGLNVEVDGYRSGQLVYSVVEVVSATSLMFRPCRGSRWTRWCSHPLAEPITLSTPTGSA